MKLTTIQTVLKKFGSSNYYKAFFNEISDRVDDLIDIKENDHNINLIVNGETNNTQHRFMITFADSGFTITKMEIHENDRFLRDYDCLRYIENSFKTKENI